jgi:DNA-directed RNA polymerase specialized sigma24 family protein
MGTYFDNDQFDPLFLRRQASDEGSSERIKVENAMAGMLLGLVKNYASHPFYRKYPISFREDLVANGMCAVWAKIGKETFNRDEGTNYFSYFTTIAKNAFLQQLRDYYKYRNRSIPMSVVEHFMTEEG